MSQKCKNVTLGLALMALFLGACQQAKDKAETEDKGGAPIAGTYNCQEQNEPQAPVEVWEVRQDGTITATGTIVTRPDGSTVVAIAGKGHENPEGSTFEGTWSAEGDTAKVTFEGETDTFKIEGERPPAGEPPHLKLVAGGGRFVCTKT